MADVFLTLCSKLAISKESRFPCRLGLALSLLRTVAAELHTLGKAKVHAIINRILPELQRSATEDDHFWLSAGVLTLSAGARENAWDHQELQAAVDQVHTFTSAFSHIKAALCLKI